MNPHPDDDTADEPLPPKLADAFARLQADPVFVPATVDEAILAAARRQLATIRPRPASILSFAPWLAAAAVIAVAGLFGLMMSRSSSTSPDAAVRRADLDESGRIDVLDAFALARRLRDGGTLEPWLDVNGDGVVDQRDVEAIAARAVRLEEGGL